jgi:uncharacterized membrane protein
MRRVPPAENFPSWAHSVSANGGAIVGLLENFGGDHIRAVRWANGNFGIAPLLPPSQEHGSYLDNEAKGVSGGGTVVVGDAGFLQRQAFRLSHGTLTSLGFLPGDNQSFANAVSGDGTIVVGQSNTRPFYFVGGGMSSIPIISGHTQGSALAASGNVIVGVACCGSNGAFIYSLGGAARSVKDALVDLGVAVPSGQFLAQAKGVSSARWSWGGAAALRVNAAGSRCWGPVRIRRFTAS